MPDDQMTASLGLGVGENFATEPGRSPPVRWFLHQRPSQRPPEGLWLDRLSRAFRIEYPQ